VALVTKAGWQLSSLEKSEHFRRRLILLGLRLYADSEISIVEAQAEGVKLLSGIPCAGVQISQGFYQIEDFDEGGVAFSGS
jgi:hypothetical protein